MTRWISSPVSVFFCTLLVLLLPISPVASAAPSVDPSHSLVAQASDEPTPPKDGSDEPEPPKAEPGSEPAKPAKPGSDEPTAPNSAQEPEEPGKGIDEPGKGVDEPDKPLPPPGTVKKKADETFYGIGLHARAIFVHPWLLGIFLDESTSLNSAAFGGEFIRRKGNMDLIASIDFGLYGPEDGNYLGKNKNPQTDTDYVQFENFNILSLTAHFIWHEGLTDWLSFVYGVGVGIGFVLGDMFRISNDPARCNRENAGDENQCFPKGVDTRTREEDIQRLTGGQDDPNDPHLFKEEDVPPVIPMIQFLVGFNFKVNDQISIRVDGGFRNAFYFGATGHWFF